jgi:hypothetical protein
MPLPTNRTNIPIKHSLQELCAVYNQMHAAKPSLARLIYSTNQGIRVFSKPYVQYHISRSLSQCQIMSSPPSNFFTKKFNILSSTPGSWKLCHLISRSELYIRILTRTYVQDFLCNHSDITWWPQSTIYIYIYIYIYTYVRVRYIVFAYVFVLYFKCHFYVKKQKIRTNFSGCLTATTLRWYDRSWRYNSIRFDTP